MIFVLHDGFNCSMKAASKALYVVLEFCSTLKAFCNCTSFSFQIILEKGLEKWRSLDPPNNNFAPIFCKLFQVHTSCASFYFLLSILTEKDFLALAEGWTQAPGLRVKCANHYTVEDCCCQESDKWDFEIEVVTDGCEFTGGGNICYVFQEEGGGSNSNTYITEIFMICL